MLLISRWSEFLMPWGILKIIFSVTWGESTLLWGSAVRLTKWSRVEKGDVRSLQQLLNWALILECLPYLLVINLKPCLLLYLFPGMVAQAGRSLEFYASFSHTVVRHCLRDTVWTNSKQLLSDCKYIIIFPVSTYLVF